MSPDVRRAFEVFCVPTKAERFLQLIDAESIKAHRKLTSLLAHGFEASPFRSDYETLHTSPIDARDSILTIARRLGRSGECNVLSENRKLDGTHMAFSDLFAAANRSGFGVFAVLDPNHLAFFQGEDAHPTTVLHKPAR